MHCIQQVAALVGVVLLLCIASSDAGCPHTHGGAVTASMPHNHPLLASRKLVQAKPQVKQLQQRLLLSTKAVVQPPVVSDAYQAAMKLLITDFEGVIGNCEFSLEGMAYKDNTNIIVSSSSVFFPAGSWLRAFFHDAGTFIKTPANGGPKGGPNGSLGAGCPNNTCGQLGTATVAAHDATCLNGAAAVGGFTDGKYYCCPSAAQCIAHGQTSNTGATPGLTVPVCLDGSAATVELCRRENDNLLPTIQFFRGRQANSRFQYGNNQQLSLADIIVAAAVVVVKQCSGGEVLIPHTFGRPEATTADDSLLPSPQGVIDQQHFEIFQNMGLNKVDMVTLVTGSHSIGGFRRFSSPGLTDCPFVPFDCTPAGQISQPPFDNDVFKVACNMTTECQWNAKCSNPSVNETAQGCPFTGSAREAFQQCNPSSYPAPGLISDAFWCSQPSTSDRMVEYAEDQTFFFSQYQSLFSHLASLGYQNKNLVTPTN